jgi:hypothetical protein
VMVAYKLRPTDRLLWTGWWTFGQRHMTSFLSDKLLRRNLLYAKHVFTKRRKFMPSNVTDHPNASLQPQQVTAIKNVFRYNLNNKYKLTQNLRSYSTDRQYFEKCYCPC